MVYGAGGVVLSGAQVFQVHLNRKETVRSLSMEKKLAQLQKHAASMKNKPKATLPDDWSSDDEESRRIKYFPPQDMILVKKG